MGIVIFNSHNCKYSLTFIIYQSGERSTSTVHIMRMFCLTVAVHNNSYLARNAAKHSYLARNAAKLGNFFVKVLSF